VLNLDNSKVALPEPLSAILQVYVRTLSPNAFWLILNWRFSECTVRFLYFKNVQ